MFIANSTNSISRVYSTEAVDIRGRQMISKNTCLAYIYNTMRYFEIRKPFSVALIQMNTYCFLITSYKLSRFFVGDRCFLWNSVAKNIKHKNNNLPCYRAKNCNPCNVYHNFLYVVKFNTLISKVYCNQCYIHL